MTEDRTSYFAAYSPAGTLLWTADNQPAAERWSDRNEELGIFPGAEVFQVTTVTTREPIKRRKLKLVSSSRS